MHSLVSFLVMIAMQNAMAAAFQPISPMMFGTSTAPIAKPITSMAIPLDKSFDGIDLELLLGSKKYKKTMKKLKREANQRKASSVSPFRKSTAQFMTTAETTQDGVESTTSPPSPPSGLKLLICGAPAAGKGTQCALIQKTFGVVHLSTGDMLRAAVAAQTPVGVLAQEFMDSGKLVPDHVMIGIVKDRLEQDDCQTKGWLLDGFPRTQAQAQALADAGITGDCFILLDVPTDILVERVVGRRTDPVTGEIYHLTFRPPPADDDEVLQRLVQRSDDTKEKILVRLEQYHANVDAVKGSFEDIMVEIDGLGKPDEVFKAIEAAVLAKVAAK